MSNAYQDYCNANYGPEDAQDEDRELAAIILSAQLVADGMAVRAHGLIYRLPLCHDFGDIHI